ncbi:MAG: hypothetical protein JWR33_178 [Naasia sp.]|jgi:sec-independent protein translocase protein TatA|uniref:twin-arginine translocase TatA/TatE family subunit n=1 Tax=Naasia sp. TaxID=2546198 RepID=UPI00263778CB|nr:twin-arginine translocase TatA/TatE family subunit [Naasia sp.]MCU1569437.1 hypothetical protein [Naasia sp.]
MGIFGNALGWPHLIVILAIILLLFGAPKLPALAKSIGQSMKILKSEIKEEPAPAPTGAPTSLEAPEPALAPRSAASTSDTPPAK